MPWPIRHGEARTKLYKVWKSMKARCLNKNHFAYDRYGGRGIVICEAWINSFQTFKKEMGERKKGYVLDRINNDGPYNKENCRWIDRKTSQRNRRCTKKIVVDGQEITTAEFAEQHNMNKKLINDRICKLGWTPEEALYGRPRKQRMHNEKGQFCS